MPLITAQVTTRLARSAKRPSSLVLLAGILVLASTCSTKQETAHLQFTAVWQGTEIGCDEGDISLSDLRFFISDLTVVDHLGGLHPISLVEDGRFQQSNIALVDLEDGQGNCLNGTPERHATVTGLTDVSDFVELRFTVGVPFSMNHANPLLASAPLDDAAMHWHWRSGYKFLRAGVSTGDDGTWLHLGSTGCEGTVQNIRSCRAPNRVYVSLQNFAPTNRIGLDLSALFAGIDLADGESSDCSSGPAEPACAPVFEALGLPFGEQAALDASVFRVLR